MAEETKENKSKKISRMTLSEIDQKIAEMRTSMGGDTSKYAEHLLKRKEVLVSS
ncbi:MAG: hypothetical protein JW938_07770 [Candidatus Omnitrophica bacterium]|nr:hypothetical protein [Candidatus Omnitrophota bacterium]